MWRSEDRHQTLGFTALVEFGPAGVGCRLTPPLTAMSGCPCCFAARIDLSISGSMTASCTLAQEIGQGLRVLDVQLRQLIEHAGLQAAVAKIERRIGKPAARKSECRRVAIAPSALNLRPARDEARPNMRAVLSNASPAASSRVRPMISSSPTARMFTSIVCPPLTISPSAGSDAAAPMEGEGPMRLHVVHGQEGLLLPPPPAPWPCWCR